LGKEANAKISEAVRKWKKAAGMKRSPKAKASAKAEINKTIKAWKASLKKLVAKPENDDESKDMKVENVLKDTLVRTPFKKQERSQKSKAATKAEINKIADQKFKDELAEVIKKAEAK